MEGNLKIIAIVIFIFLVTGLTVTLGMPYGQLDWADYALAYQLPKYQIYLPFMVRGGS